MTFEVDLKAAVESAVVWQCLVVGLIELIYGFSKWSSEVLATRNFLIVRSRRIWTRQNLWNFTVQLQLFLFRKKTLLSSRLRTLHTGFG